MSESAAHEGNREGAFAVSPSCARTSSGRTESGRERRRIRLSLFRLSKIVLLLFFVVFLLPVAATALWWTMQERPVSWRAANWGSSGLLSDMGSGQDAAVYVLAARTGGLKGAVSVHSWLLVKRPGADGYDRYDKVGWGSPIRKNGYAADAFWYSNRPWVVHAVTGEEAERLIPEVEAAITSYPWAMSGGYRIWPGPNSNSFVAYVLNEVPALGALLPPNATGRDFAPGIASLSVSSDGRDVHATIAGLAGVAFGARHGFEVHLLGLVAGVDFARPAIKVPALGRIDLGW